MDTVAFLGLGAMGSRMAQRLLGQGHTLKVWNRSPGPTEALAERGAVRAATPREAAAGADVVISIVSDDRAARSVWLDAEAGACAGLGPGALAVESSSVTPAWILELGGAVHAAGADLVDAQVTGSRPQAEAGQLIYMIGGEEAGFERAREILKPLGSAFYHIGPLSKGSIFKLAVNALFAAQLASVAELLGTLARSGIDERMAVETLTHFPTLSPAMAGNARLMVERRTSPLFTIDLMTKDLGYALEVARAAGAQAPIVEASHNVFEAARDKGFGGKNISALRLLYE
ncbi:MAG: NAD(P)-dependent oxidoreductase [Roseiarcus sp.]|uniref:NAD(P)-dependent oxidoreductase n=1 Tax=Roseiarcus sp. TaxID=1969460 RepID=UPI003BB12E54